MTPTRHLMVDLETFGSDPGCAIASIGAVAFDPVTGAIGPTFYRLVEPKSCTAAGLTIDGDTFLFWLRQGEEARKALTEGARVPLASALDAFTAFWSFTGATHLWCHGPSFDDPILAAAYRALGREPPWPYWQSRCTRTIYELADVKPQREAGVHHNALDDALVQARAVIAARAKLTPVMAEAAASEPQPQPPVSRSRALHDIHVERVRQIEFEGFSEEHDDDYVGGALLKAAKCYLAHNPAIPRPARTDGAPEDWPWDASWWKPKDRRSNLVRAGALCLAEKGRLGRRQSLFPYLKVSTDEPNEKLTQIVTLIDALDAEAGGAADA